MPKTRKTTKERRRFVVLDIFAPRSQITRTGTICTDIYIKFSPFHLIGRISLHKVSGSLEDRVAQRLAYQTSDLGVAGSNPVSVT